MNYMAEIATSIRREVDPVLLPDGESDGLFLFYAVLALAKGTVVTAEDVHNAWAAWMTGSNPDHESIKRFSDLSAAVQREDEPFVRAIRHVAGRLSHR
jgi:hypothetical protein